MWSWHKCTVWRMWIISAWRCIAAKDNTIAETFLKNIIRQQFLFLLPSAAPVRIRNWQPLLSSHRKKVHTLAMTAVSFHQIEFTFDRRVMSAILNDCRELLHQAIKRHLTAKSHSRVNHVFNHFADCDFLACLYGPSEVYRAHLQRICNGVNKMLDEGNLWPPLASSSGTFPSSHPSCTILQYFFLRWHERLYFPFVALCLCAFSAVTVILKESRLVSPKSVSSPVWLFVISQ